MEGRRRLAGSTIGREMAEVACSDWPAATRDMCIYDTMATGDLDLAKAGSF